MNKTKTMALQQKKTLALIIAALAMFVLAATFIVLYVVSAGKNARYGTTLENMYQRSLYELNNTVNNIEVKTSKVLVSGDPQMQEMLLDDIWRDCNSAQADLALLPLSDQSLVSTLSFVNQMGGYAFSLATKVAHDETLNENDFSQLESMHKYCKTIQENLQRCVQQVASGQFKISDGLNSKNAPKPFEENFSQINNNTSDTPELIYDGPFSESLSDKEIKGLPEEECTEEQARAYVNEIFKNESMASISFDGESTGGDFETFVYTVSLNNSDSIHIQIAKRGKFLLQFNRNSDVNGDENNIKSDADYIETAEKFVKEIGLNNMKAIFISRGEGLAYVNVAPVINGIVHTPDLIKVKINLFTNTVTGYEAKNYAFNHVERANLKPAISVEEAQSRVSSRLTVVQKRLALISKQYGNEVLTYEFECKYDGITFYVFINAESGAEEEIFRVIENTEGQMVI